MNDQMNFAVLKIEPKDRKNVGECGVWNQDGSPHSFIGLIVYT